MAITIGKARRPVAVGRGLNEVLDLMMKNKVMQQKAQNEAMQSFGLDKQLSDLATKEYYNIDDQEGQIYDILQQQQEAQQLAQLGQNLQPQGQQIDESQLDIPALTKQIQEQVSQLSPEDKNALRKEIAAARKEYGRQERSTKKRPARKVRSKELTTDVVDSFLRKADGDPDRAREMARKSGYKI
jgi:hypothetical protein